MNGGISMYANLVDHSYEYYKFIGWAEKTDNYMKIIKSEIKSGDVMNFITDDIIKQAEEQALYKNEG